MGQRRFSHDIPNLIAMRIVLETLSESWFSATEETINADATRVTNNSWCDSWKPMWNAFTPTTNFVEAISLKLNLHDFPLWLFFYDTFDYSFEKKLYERISSVFIL